jgi:formylglycine-generating enzyme required for sulfatase activity
MFPGMNCASRQFRLCSWLALLIAVRPINALSQTMVPSQPNSLRLERSGTRWQLRFELAATNGTFRIVRSDNVQSLVNAAQGLAIVGVTDSPRTGVIDVPEVTTSPTFFGLVRVQSTLFLPPPGMVTIPGGTFVMGSPATESGPYRNETQHPVTLTRDFYMGKYEVTQKEYLAVMGSNPSYFTTKDYDGKAISPDLNRPVEQVSWNDAMNYCAKVTASEQAAGRLPAGWVYRLPTEAEWEYACRAGTATAFCFGNELRSGMANFDGRYEYPPGPGESSYHYNPSGMNLRRTTAVGSYQPSNAFGLYDMHGNVLEWCLDWYGSNPSGSVPDPVDPRGQSTGSNRVIRGGDWANYAIFCRSAHRYSAFPGFRSSNVGFRPVLAPAE